MLTTQKIAKDLCKMEGLKEEVNIAQMNEIVSKIPELIASNPKSILDYLRYFLKDVDPDSGVFVEFCTFDNGKRVDEIGVSVRYT
jgi:hypothetical protein